MRARCRGPVCERRPHTSALDENAVRVATRTRCERQRRVTASAAAVGLDGRIHSEEAAAGTLPNESFEMRRTGGAKLQSTPGRCPLDGRQGLLIE